MTSAPRQPVPFAAVAEGRDVRVFSGPVRMLGDDYKTMETHSATLIFVPTDHEYDNNTFSGPQPVQRLFVSWDGGEFHEAVSTSTTGFTFTSFMKLIVPGVCGFGFHSLDRFEQTIESGATDRSKTVLTRQPDPVLPETYVPLPDIIPASATLVRSQDQHYLIVGLYQPYGGQDPWRLYFFFDTPDGTIGPDGVEGVNRTADIKDVKATRSKTDDAVLIDGAWLHFRELEELKVWEHVFDFGRAADGTITVKVTPKN